MKTENPINLFENYLIDTQFPILVQIREEMKSILETNILMHFTDHSISHSDRMMNILMKVISNNLSLDSPNKLSSDEIFILVSAIYLHDISLQIPKAFGITKSISEFTGNDYNTIRENHGAVSGEIIRKMGEKNEYGIALSFTKYSINRMVPYVAQLCESHQSSREFSAEETIQFRGNGVRIGLLTGLLRIVDQLDCDHQRVNMDRLNQYSISNESLYHWISCHYIESVTIMNGLIKVTFTFPETISSPLIKELYNSLMKKIESELSLCQDELWKNNIPLKLVNKIELLSNENNLRPISGLPDKIQEILSIKLKDDDSGPEVAQHKMEEAMDWMSYWGMIGNPFLDLPIAYGNDNLIETNQYKKIYSEINQFLSAKQGDVRLLIGERGLGKTTLFQILSGHYKSKGYPVHIIDVADIVLNAKNSTDLFNRLFLRTDTFMFGGTSEFNRNDFMEKVSRGKPRLICIDSLDRLPSEKEVFIREFFKVSQHLLSTIKGNSLILFSCSEKWKSFLDSTELSYLGYRNQWKLEKFSTNEARMMIKRRLATTGIKFNDIFEEECIIPIHTISKGNPREILKTSENICRLAFQKKIEQITPNFIRNEYVDEFEVEYKKYLKNQCEKSTKFKNGIISIYCYLSDMERRNLDVNRGFDYLTKMIISDLNKSLVDYRYYTPISYVGQMMISRSSNEQDITTYKTNPDVKFLFTTIKKRGYSPKDFLSYYSTNSYVPPDDQEDIINKIRIFSEPYPDYKYLENAKMEFHNIDSVSGTWLVKKCWEIIELQIVAILLKTNEITEQWYEDKKQDVYVIDRYDRKVFKRGAGNLLSNLAYDLTEKLQSTTKMKSIWIKHLSSIKWIRSNRQSIVKGRVEHTIRYAGKEYQDLCKQQLEWSFKELLKIYDMIKRVE